MTNEEYIDILTTLLIQTKKDGYLKASEAIQELISLFEQDSSTLSCP